MAKHPIYRLHKIKVHHNRWLAWAVAYSVIIAIALTGYIVVSEVNFETQTAENNYYPSHIYQDTRLGFSVLYPADWSIEADDNSTISFVPMNDSDQGVSVQVTGTQFEKTIRNSLDILKETGIKLDNKPAVKITNDLGRGYSESIILATHNNKLYVVRGTDSLVQRLTSAFHFKTVE